MRNTHNAADSRLRCPAPRSRAIFVQGGHLPLSPACSCVAPRQTGKRRKMALTGSELVQHALRLVSSPNMGTLRLFLLAQQKEELCCSETVVEAFTWLLWEKSYDYYSKVEEESTVAQVRTKMIRYTCTHLLHTYEHWFRSDTTCTSTRFFAKYTHFPIVFAGSAERGTLLLWNGGWSIHLAALR